MVEVDGHSRADLAGNGQNGAVVAAESAKYMFALV